MSGRKPKLNEDALRSELSESRFFQRQPVVPEAPSEPHASVRAVESSISEDPRTPVRPSVRTLTRMPFEIFRDQHATLKQWSLEEQARGERGSMSEMVRAAIDAYIAKRQQQAGP